MSSLATYFKNNSTIIHLSSKDRQFGGSDGEFQYTPTQNVRFNKSNEALIHLSSCVIPCSFYNIPDGDNTLYFGIYQISTTTETIYTITITPNNYTLDTLAAEVQSKMRTATGLSTLTVTLNSPMMLYTINTANSDYHIQLKQPSYSSSNKVAVSLGFYYFDYYYEYKYKVYESPYSQIITSPEVSQLDIYEISIHSSLAKQSLCHNKPAFIFEVIPLNTPQGGVSQWQARLEHNHVVNQQQLSSFSIQFFRNDIQKTVDFNGCSPSLTFIINISD